MQGKFDEARSAVVENGVCKKCFSRGPDKARTHQNIYKGRYRAFSQACRPRHRDPAWTARLS